MPPFRCALLLILSSVMIHACAAAPAGPTQAANPSQPNAVTASSVPEAQSPPDDNTALFDENFRQNPEDCENFEVFDDELQVCVLDCETDEACDMLEAQIEQEFNALEQGFFENERPASSQFAAVDSTALQDKEHATLRYRVAQGELGELSQNLKGRTDLPEVFQAKATHNQIWELYQNISSSALLQDVLIFDLVYDDTGSGNVALVSPIEQDNKRWLVEANVSELLKQDGDSIDLSTLRHTMIHEFAHILTLHDTQVDGQNTEGSCPRFQLQEGCSRENAYIDGFFQKFWKDKFDEFQRIQNLEDKTRQQQESEAFYEKFKSAFVTAYAASNPAEDIAESFTAFVIKQNKPTGSTQADQKVAFFYDYPELLQLRAQIRQRIAFQSGDFQTQFFHPKR